MHTTLPYTDAWVPLFSLLNTTCDCYRPKSNKQKSVIVTDDTEKPSGHIYSLIFTFLHLLVPTLILLLDLKGSVWVKTLHSVHWGSPTGHRSERGRKTGIYTENTILKMNLHILLRPWDHSSLFLFTHASRNDRQCYSFNNVKHVNTHFTSAKSMWAISALLSILEFHEIWSCLRVKMDESH